MSVKAMAVCDVEPGLGHGNLMGFSEFLSPVRKQTCLCEYSLLPG